MKKNFVSIDQIKRLASSEAARIKGGFTGSRGSLSASNEPKPMYGVAPPSDDPISDPVTDPGADPVPGPPPPNPTE